MTKSTQEMSFYENSCAHNWFSCYLSGNICLGISNVSPRHAPRRSIHTWCSAFDLSHFSQNKRMIFEQQLFAYVSCDRKPVFLALESLYFPAKENLRLSKLTPFTSRYLFNLRNFLKFIDRMLPFHKMRTVFNLIGSIL